MLKNILLVGLGGGIGSILRYCSSLLINSKYFPWSTFLVNIMGSFIIGLVIAFSLRDGSFSNNWKLFLATGICGGFTTFSAFSAENLTLFQNGKYGMAILYMILSFVLGIIAVFLGYQLAIKN
ncbi:MAG TPA: fluoride efflux transporter CrcB [Ferruginibacter sp.]|nr:fluoride efflux transporter CrcB [Ferruginibacter sp.]